ncbi:hypothetical protein [Sinorhizobium meliloti]|uniref:hypothetical protein n=1 Tax=Rhizobium meliloti TaxID=382 RepID=UPI000FD4E9D5|nr:hypothetical protein [Sinorhizobium meliloti]RVJ64540.1 hypothetical protein CN171_34510 [Sinorhizobium meliloti]
MAPRTHPFRDNATLRLENTRPKVDNQLLRDEIARLKNLPPQPPFPRSGMKKATDDKRDKPQAARKKPRGPKHDLKWVSREESCASMFRPARASKATKAAMCAS